VNSTLMLILEIWLLIVVIRPKWFIWWHAHIVCLCGWLLKSNCQSLTGQTRNKISSFSNEVVILKVKKNKTAVPRNYSKEKQYRTYLDLLHQPSKSNENTMSNRSCRARMACLAYSQTNLCTNTCVRNCYLCHLVFVFHFIIYYLTQIFSSFLRTFNLMPR